MKIRVPHVLPYQGSKRKLASKILSYIDFKVNKLYEPFAGSAALTLAAANSGIAEKYIFGDKLEVLSELWELVVNEPNQLINSYDEVWRNQLENPNEYYNLIRKKFNDNHEPSLFLYLAARCVKNAIRFNSQGEFNQGMDKRRLGTRPEKMKQEILLASSLLKNKCEIRKGDFREIIKDAGSNDLIYMDPPWQGTSNKANPRYAFLLELDEFIESIEDLNDRNVPFIISFDGVCGDKKYGKDLPKHLELTKLVLNAGRSTQSTLLGESSVTLESLYLSKHFTSFEKTVEVEETSQLSFSPELVV